MSPGNEPFRSGFQGQNLGQLLGLLDVFSGGSLQTFSIVALGPLRILRPRLRCNSCNRLELNVQSHNLPAHEEECYCP